MTKITDVIIDFVNLKVLIVGKWINLGNFYEKFKDVGFRKEYCNLDNSWHESIVHYFPIINYD